MPDRSPVALLGHGQHGLVIPPGMETKGGIPGHLESTKPVSAKRLQSAPCERCLNSAAPGG